MSKSLMRRQRLERPREPKAPTFRHWLRGQRDRTDEIGDLARRVLHAKGDLPANTLEAYRTALHRSGSTGAMLTALEDAWAEYEESRRS